MPSSEAEQLGALVRDARVAARPPSGVAPTQAWLGQQFVPPRHAQQISQFEKGTTVPELGVLAELYTFIHASHPDSATTVGLASWVAAWIATRRPREPQAHDLLAGVVHELASWAQGPSGRRREGRTTALCSLADFPNREPCTIILGDRRETTKDMSAADCMIHPGSVTDAMYLPELGVDISHFRIKSDKVLVRMPEKSLRSMPEIAESHLLVLGSPAANWAARILNAGAVFPFRIDPDAVHQNDRMLTEGRMQDPEFAAAFWRIAQLELDQRATERTAISDDPARRIEQDAIKLVDDILPKTNGKTVMNKFRTLGFLDPADEENHGTFWHPANDFAVVTIARNPYSVSGHRAIICAGIHGPGTAAALRELLTRPETFADRPLGAVLEVKLNLGLDWPQRFEQSTVVPQTRPYGPSTVRENLEHAVATAPGQRRGVYKDWEPTALRSALDIVRELEGTVSGA